METKQINFGDRQRPLKAVNDWHRVSLALKVANLNEDFERPLTTMKDCSTTLKDRQRLAVISKDPDTPETVKDRQRHSATLWMIV